MRNWIVKAGRRGDGWVCVEVEDQEDGAVLATVTAPVVDGATFDAEGAAVLTAVAEAVTMNGTSDA